MFEVVGIVLLVVVVVLVAVYIGLRKLTSNGSLGEVDSDLLLAQAVTRGELTLETTLGEMLPEVALSSPRAKSFWSRRTGPCRPWRARARAGCGSPWGTYSTSWKS